MTNPNDPSLPEMGGDSTPLSPYDAMTDEEVVALCHEGDERAINHLLYKYKNFVR